MGLLSRAGDLAYSLRFLRLLTTSFDDTTAFRLGIIDEKGKKLKKPQTSEEKSAYNTFHRLVFSLKKLLAKVPGGSSKIASYAAALLLLKEHDQLSDETIEKLVEHMGIDPLDFLEEETQWFRTKEGMLSPGSYTLLCPKLVNTTCEELCKVGDKVIVEMDTYAKDTIMGIEVFEATHTPTNQKVYVTIGEITR